MNTQVQTNGIAVEVLVLLSGGHAVPKALYDAARVQIEEILPAIWPGEPYTVEMMCGPDFWGQLDEYECQLVGRCVAQMVARGELPLEFVGCRHASPKRYRLK